MEHPDRLVFIFVYSDNIDLKTARIVNYNIWNIVCIYIIIQESLNKEFVQIEMREEASVER